MSLPIVLIHGFPLDSAIWAPQKAALEAAGHRVFTPDLPGFGSAPAWPQDRCSIEAFAHGIHELIRGQIGEPAIVGGLSMGGYILLALLRAHPESVRAAMLFDTRPDPDTPEARATRLKTIAEVPTQGTAALVETMLSRVVGKRADNQVRAQVRAIMARQSVEGIVGAQWAMAHRQDQTHLLATLQMPVLLVVGADDVITPPSVALNMHNHMRHAMLVQIAGAGHLANFEAPEPVNEALQTFLGTI